MKSPRSRLRIRTAAILVAVCVFAAGCRRNRPVVPYPHESVLSVIAELKIFLRSDPYRAEPGRDLEGRNIFRVSLDRLAALDDLLGPDYEDILAFARAECFERLGAWDAAAAEFARVSSLETSLSEEAEIRRQWAERLARTTAGPGRSETLADYLNHLDSVEVKLLQLREAEPVFPYESFILMELEKSLRREAAFLFGNRNVLPEGRARAIETAEKLALDHAGSRRRGEHLLLLATMHEGGARDYLHEHDPTGSGFELEAWQGMVARAREAYTEVARRDGDPAKPEGQARLRALDAFALRILRAAR